MSNPDKRSPHTDALDTLGTCPIDENQKRDAIHLAVEPVVAGEDLTAGDHIVVRFGKAYRAEANKGHGIVDPFIVDPDGDRWKTIKKGMRFWCVIYPRQIRSLRHVWSHPAFPDAGDVGPKDSKETSELWLREFLADNDLLSYEQMLIAVNGGSIDPYYAGCDNDGEHFLIKGSSVSGSIPDEFWDHIEVVTGKAYPRAKYFSCSC